MAQTKQRQLGKNEWLKTPYARSEATDPDKAIRDLFYRRKIAHHQFTEMTGPNGRPMFGVRFEVDKRVYHIRLETLPVMNVKPDLTMRQVKRAVYYMLKSLLEYTTVFTSLEEVLFGFMEDPSSGETVYETVRPGLAALPPAGIVNAVNKVLALPAHQPGGS